ncbi:hypothetical protein [Streptomyces sp. NPDC056160]|uniref:hypothetical protein n=1 Tax=Streptomyces sp. NPDC056160 TaxID=3345731 RepID=UPI0035D87144
MSFNDELQSAQQEATLALLTNIKEAAKESGKLNPGNQAEALKNLAEAYAWLTVPNNSH